MQAIRILCVGGTIDKVYFDALSEYEVGVPYALEMLEELNLNLDCRVTSLMRKDSLEMDDADRALVRDAAAQTEEELIVITHGTDTMVDTANALSSLYSEKSYTKTIVLTGALTPAIFKKSDAMFNLGAALTGRANDETRHLYRHEWPSFLLRRSEKRQRRPTLRRCLDERGCSIAANTTRRTVLRSVRQYSYSRV